MNLRPVLLHTLLALSQVEPSLALAHERLRPHSLTELSHRTERSQRHYRVPGAKVAWVNYPGIKRDYPETRGYSDPQIDAWILKHFAYVSEMQLRLRGIRVSHFEVDLNDVKILVHPGAYYRAGVIEIPGMGAGTTELMDLKGSGHSDEVTVNGTVARFGKLLAALEQGLNAGGAIDDLRVEGHTDGVLSFGEGVAEISRGLAIQAAYDIYNREHGTAFETIENYFLLDFGFQILKRNGESIPASLLGRQPHWRGDKAELTPPTIFIDPYGDLQSSVFGTNVDFGGAVITEKNLQHSFGPYDPKGPKPDPQHGPAWRYAHETADYFRRVSDHDYPAARAAMNSHFEKMLEPLAAKHQALAPLSESLQYQNYLLKRLPVTSGWVFDKLLDEVLNFQAGDLVSSLDYLYKTPLPHRTFGRILESLLIDGHLDPKSEIHDRLIDWIFREGLEGLVKLPSTMQTARVTIAVLSDPSIITKSERYYRLLDKLTQTGATDLYAPKELSALLAEIANDQNPVAVPFILYCLNHDNEVLSGKAFRILLARQPSELAAHLDTLLKLEPGILGIRSKHIGPLILRALNPKATDYWKQVDRALNQTGRNHDLIRDVIEGHLEKRRTRSFFTPKKERARINERLARIQTEKRACSVYLNKPVSN